jgi:hypothetical protein
MLGFSFECELNHGNELGSEATHPV